MKAITKRAVFEVRPLSSGTIEHVPSSVSYANLPGKFIFLLEHLFFLGNNHAFLSFADLN